MTGRLKVWDADTSTWKYVDASGAAVEMLRYVPLSTMVEISPGGGYTANVAQTHLPPMTFLPLTAVAVSLLAFATSSTVSPSHRVIYYGYGQPTNYIQLCPGKVASHYESETAHYVPLGGDRQIDWSLSIGGAVTITALAYVTGYWVKDISTGVGTGGGTSPLPAPVKTSSAANATASTTTAGMGADWTRSVVAPVSGRVLLCGVIDMKNPNTAAIADYIISYNIDGGAWVQCAGHAFDGTAGPARIPIPFFEVITGLNPNQSYSIALGHYVSSGTTGILEAAGRGGANLGSRMLLLPLA